MLADTPAKQLLFCTVRITNKPSGTVGTGFLFNASTDPLRQMPVIITNKHVVVGASELVLDFVGQNTAGTGPDLQQHIEFTLDGNPQFIGHPEPLVDVAVLSLTELWGELLAMKPPPYITTVGWENLPTAAALPQFDVIEKVTFIGYPNGLRDSLHGTPIVRQAITATPLELPFGGKPTFLLDGGVFGGSSGSPVFVFDSGSWTDTKGTTMSGGTRLFLVGIVAETYQSNTKLPIIGLATMPGAVPPHVEVAHALDLGVAFSSTAIIETVNHALKLSGKPTGQGMQEYK